MLESIVESLGNNGEAPRMVQLGKIKIGGLGQKRTAAGGREWRMPEKHDAFTVCTMNRSKEGDLVPDEQLMKALIENYGDKDGKLRQIPIRVMSNDIGDILQSNWLWYGGKSCGARSDGKKTTWFINPKDMQRYDPPAESDWRTGDEKEYKDKNGKPLFKLHSILNCVVAAEDARWGGVYQMRTTSIISFKQLYASLVHIHQLTGGILIGMPLMLVVRPVQVSPEGKATTVYVVHVELRGSEMRQIQQQAMQQQAWMIENKTKMLTMQASYQRLLVAPGHEPQSDALTIAAEFQPESLEIEPAPDNFNLIDGDPGDGAPAVNADAPKDNPPESSEQNIEQEIYRESNPVGGEPTDEISEDEKQEITLRELFGQGEAVWKRAMIDRASAIDKRATKLPVAQAITRFAESHKTTVNKLTFDHFKEAYKLIDAGKLDVLAGAFKN